VGREELTTPRPRNHFARREANRVFTLLSDGGQVFMRMLSKGEGG
jgi:hypothetical protein